MLIDSRTLPNQSTIEGDLCIVGAGAAGLSMALDWINSPYKVVLLEAGGFEYEDQIQDFYKGSLSGQRYFPLRACRIHHFGGTTGHWAGMCSPLDPIDFKARSWVPNSGWPISREDLDPFFEKAQKIIQIGPYEYGLDYWKEVEKEYVPLPLNEEVVWNKMWQFCRKRHFKEEYREAITKATNIHLYTYAKATDIKATENLQEISRIEVKNLEGKTHHVKAKKFVLALGSIQNARLLLASNKQATNGLGNQNDQVGRNFMEHIETSTGDLWLFNETPVDLYRWPMDDKRYTRAELAITPAYQEKEKILNGTLGFLPLTVGKNFKPRMETWQNEDPRKSADNMFASLEEGFQAAENNKDPILERAFQLDIRMEQSPNPNSRVTLGTERDALGIPLAHLHWELTPLEKYSARVITELVAKAVGEAGVGRIQLREFLRDQKDPTFPDSTNGGWHHMGTTRMSTDAKNGVVDADCKIHGINNLYVAGAGCFATSGAPNPTLTLIALTLRLSEHLKQNLNPMV